MLKSLIWANQRLLKRFKKMQEYHKESHQIILTHDFDVSCVSAKSVPISLTEDQKENKISISEVLLETAEITPDFLHTGDEKFDLHQDEETKSVSQLKTINSQRLKKIWQVKLSVKLYFFYFQGTVYQERVPIGQSIKQHFYLGVLKSVRKKKPYS